MEAKKEGDKGGGDHHPPPAAGSKVGMAWGMAILAFVVIMSGVIGALGNQIAELLQVVKMYTPQILIGVAVIWFIKSPKK